MRIPWILSTTFLVAVRQAASLSVSGIQIQISLLLEDDSDIQYIEQAGTVQLDISTDLETASTFILQDYTGYVYVEDEFEEFGSGYAIPTIPFGSTTLYVVPQDPNLLCFEPLVSSESHPSLFRQKKPPPCSSELRKESEIFTQGTRCMGKAVLLQMHGPFSCLPSLFSPFPNFLLFVLPVMSRHPHSSTPRLTKSTLPPFSLI